MDRNMRLNWKPPAILDPCTKRMLQLIRYSPINYCLIWLILQLMVLDYYCSIYCNALQFQYLSFQEPTAASTSNITLVSHYWYPYANAYFSNSSIWLTDFKSTSLNGAPSDKFIFGRVAYKEPIQFDLTNASSFTTSFTFQIITTRPFPQCGSGMTFFIADSLQAPVNSSNKGALGLFNPDLTTPSPSTFFAVEFDTRKTSIFYDPSASHIGIDVNSVISLNATDTSPGSLYPQLFLYNNSTFTAWIEYNASTHLIQVWMSNHSATNSSGASGTFSAIDRPGHPCLELQYDLSAVFSQKSMYIGFTGVSAPGGGGNMEGHVIYSWSFSNELSVMSTPHRNFKLYVALAPAAAGLVLLLIITTWTWVLLQRKRNQRKHAANAAGRIESALQTARPFTYKELRRATNDFDERRKIGQGGYGSVYKGILVDGSVVAVKKLKQSLMLEAEFCAEVSIIRKVRHRYLLELQGWCYEDGQEALLVSQYMSKGSLDGYLFNASKKKVLGKSAIAQKETRVRILAQVAEALEYLHGGLGECVLHRDVKAGNVLLMDNIDKEEEEVLEARLCDFGLARLISHEKLGAVAMTAAGTPGYVAPELLYRGMPTDKADVFSFGVLALEIACGRRAVFKDQQADQQHIYDWLWSYSCPSDTTGQQAGGTATFRDEELCQVLDPILVVDDDSTVLHDWRCVLHVGLMCCHPIAECRPSMKEVTRAFDAKLLFPLPENKPCLPFATAGNWGRSTPFASNDSSDPAASLLSAPITSSTSNDSSYPAASLLSAPR